MTDSDAKTPTAAVVSKLISQVLELPEVWPDMTIHNTVEGDSLAHLQMLAVLEDHFGCELDLEAVSDVQSIEDWIQVIERHNV